MKNLFLIRHAKSDHPPFTEDFSRTLTGSGKTDAALVASKAKAILPSQYIIWSSNAVRATATAKIFASQWSLPQEDIHYIDQLYTFDSNSLEKTIHSCSDSHSNLVVFGHNEAITEFVNKFGDIYIDNVPTSGLVHLTFENNHWASISRGHTERVILPRDLRL
ncbi:MAG TPA: histidine phosphatase family protein [Flavobacterium sp.]|jgi:phosphohistidine phosphatase